MDWQLSALLPDVIVIGAIALGGAVVTCSLLGCFGAACSSREALLLYTFLLLPCLVVAAGVTGLSVAGADTAVATLAELSHREHVSRAAIGHGATPYAAPSLSSGSSEEMLRTLYSGWESLYLDCAPAVGVGCEGGSGDTGSGALTNSSGCGSRSITAADYAAMDRILRDERKYILNMCKKIKKSGANVVLIQKSILRDAYNELSLHFLAKMGILVVTDIERTDVEFVCRTLGCTPVPHVNSLSPKKL